ncbi:MAG: hypothetical protein Q8M16_05680 [Pirellulaceae bacterium]|nr:hypothetical protein [Pirellulaceae bacterium]
MKFLGADGEWQVSAIDDLVWVLLLACLFAGFCCAGVLVRHSRTNRLSDLHRDQRGGAYTLNYLLAIFSLFLFTCVVIECTQIFLARLGTVYAGFAAARTAIVHPAGAEREDLAEKAAQRAFLPFARGLAAQDSKPLSEEDASTPLWRAYESVAKQPIQASYFARKEISSVDRIRVELQETSDGDTTMVSLRLRYDYPLMFPFLGVVLGTIDDSEYQRELEAVINLPDEAPRNTEQRLGINYAGY